MEHFSCSFFLLAGFELTVPVQTLYILDRPFHNSTSQRILFSSETSYDGFQSSKIVKGSVGLYSGCESIYWCPDKRCITRPTLSQSKGLEIRGSPFPDYYYWWICGLWNCEKVGRAELCLISRGQAGVWTRAPQVSACAGLTTVLQSFIQIEKSNHSAFSFWFSFLSFISSSQRKESNPEEAG